MFITFRVQHTQIFENKFDVGICLSDSPHVSIVGMHVVQAVPGDLAVGLFWFIPRQLDGWICDTKNCYIQRLAWHWKHKPRYQSPMVSYRNTIKIINPYPPEAWTRPLVQAQSLLQCCLYLSYHENHQCSSQNTMKMKLLRAPRIIHKNIASVTWNRQ